MNKRPLIFISNDDGINARGLFHLIDCVKEMGDIIAVAPDMPHSAQSSAISVEKPLRITRHNDYRGAQIYSVSGTPVDCVKLGLHAIVDRKPDLMLSGINHGSNSGNSIIYSGTMGAAMEACMAGIPSIGYSLLDHSPQADFTRTTGFITKITGNVIQHGLPKDVCLNVNIPANCKPNGIKITRAARGHWGEEYAEYTDPHGRKFYWLTGHFVNEEPESDETDIYWLDRQYVTVVPARPDQTAIDSINGINHLID